MVTATPGSTPTTGAFTLAGDLPRALDEVPHVLDRRVSNCQRGRPRRQRAVHHAAALERRPAPESRNRREPRPLVRRHDASSASGAVRRNQVQRRRSAGYQWRRHGLVHRGELHAMPRGDREQIEVRQLLRRYASELSERRRVRYRDFGWQEADERRKRAHITASECSAAGRAASFPPLPPGSSPDGRERPECRQSSSWQAVCP